MPHTSFTDAIIIDPDGQILCTKSAAYVRCTREWDNRPFPRAKVSVWRVQAKEMYNVLKESDRVYGGHEIS